jgi:5-methyltetrahydropteroyltriglutamate--homocysteine methyltransferase
MTSPKTQLPRFPVTTVGSWPRPKELLKAQKLLRLGRISLDDFHRVADESVLRLLKFQQDAGIDLITDGEQRRDNFYSFTADKIEGVKLMTLVEVLDLLEDKEAFEQILETLDVPAYSLSTPVCLGPVRRKSSLAAQEYKFLREHNALPIKVPLPGPYLLTRAMYLEEVTREFYANKEALGHDVVQLLREELMELMELGVDFVQFDEPVLTEIVFTPGRTRTFMCASLAASGDPAEELEFALDLMRRLTEGLPVSKTTVGLHICRGNWSQNEEILLSGSYSALLNYLEKVPVDQLVLEYATERAGSIMKFAGKSIGLGVVNPRIETVESPDQIIAKVREALDFYEPDQIYLNPDCGFGTFSNSPVNSDEIAVRKLQSMVQAAEILRAEYT